LNAAHTSGCSWIALPSISTGSKRLDAQAMQRRGAVQEHGMLADHLVENIPDLGTLFFDKLLRLFHRGGQTLGVEPRIR